jgi:two-component system capsular synthesis response regulator RcsB
VIETVRIILADDHPVVLIGVRALLQAQGARFQIVGEAHDGESLLVLLKQQSCELLITDFSMPVGSAGQDGLLLLRSLQRDFPGLPVLVLTMIRNPAAVAGMLATGVRGVVDKSSLAHELITAIGAVLHKRSYVSETLRDPLAEPRSTTVDTDDVGIAPKLSPREAEVVRLFVQGLSVTQIAEQLHRSVKTVSQQKNDAMRKLGLISHIQLYEYARSSGLS